ncbi:UNVERIFIED_CONTAM: ferredoxin-NADP reductase [Williamsia faeni]
MTSATESQSSHTASTVERLGVRPDGSFTPIRVKEVKRETGEAISLIFDVAEHSSVLQHYEAGQFLTLRVTIEGEPHVRCYSMSSSPVVDDHVQVTVKRERGGLVSNWLNDNISDGSLVDVAGPAGTFVLNSSARDIVAFAGGSGITPVFSIVRTALESTARRVSLLFANRDRESVIFATALEDLVARYPDRLTVEHRFDDEHGRIDIDGIVRFAGSVDEVEFYICGPGPFMNVVEKSLLERRVETNRLHLERFVPAEIPCELSGDAQGSGTHTVVVQINRRTTSVDYRKGTTLLQAGRAAGLRPPSLCETGSCGTCIARITDGEVTMLNNEVLTPAEVAEGWILTCQALPISPSIHIAYE